MRLGLSGVAGLSSPAPRWRRWRAVPAAGLVALLSACAGEGTPTGPDGGNVVAINIVGSERKLRLHAQSGDGVRGLRT